MRLQRRSLARVRKPEISEGAVSRGVSRRGVRGWSIAIADEVAFVFTLSAWRRTSMALILT
jgi:hypothetical protein